MTDLNTLKNWFRTGLKPTQEQFSAWIDSFWHKNEKIPQSSIDGLDTTLENKADADQLKNKADLVGGKIPLSQMPFADDVLEFPAESDFPAQGAVGKIYLDLAADKPFVWDAESAAYKPAGGDDVRMAQIEQNLATEITNRIDADAGKVDKPTADGNWVLNKLGSVFSWVDASNFGKNVANTLLDSVANAGINLKANWRIVTNNFAFYIEGLIDKSTDSRYSFLIAQDENGQTVKINGKEVFKKLPLILSTAEKNQFSLDWSNQYSNGKMSVYMIVSPPISNVVDTVSYITLQGLNFLLDKQYTRVTLIPVSNDLGAGEIDVLGISTFPNGDKLVITAKNTTLPSGDYNVVIRTTSPTIQTYRTTQSITVNNNNNNNNNNNLSEIVWSKRTLTGAENSRTNGNAGTFNLQYNPTSGDNGFQYSEVLETNFLGTATDNIYLEINLSFFKDGDNHGETYPICLGFDQSQDILTFVQSMFSYGGLKSTQWYGGGAVHWMGQGQGMGNATSGNNKIILTKKGNVVSIVFTDHAGNNYFFLNTLSTNSPIKLKGLVFKNSERSFLSGSIIQYIKF